MAGPYATFQNREYQENITQKTHPEFLFHLQQALLMALQEQGTLSITEYRRAEEKLSRQYLALKKRDSV